MVQNDKLIVIITINFNQSNYSLSCLDSLLNLEYGNFIVLIVDNGSIFENYNELKSNLPDDPRIHLIPLEKNRGYCGGVNFALKEGIKYNPEYFLIMNNDTIIDKMAANELVQTCNKYNNKAIVSGKVYNYDEPKKIQQLGAVFISERFLRYKPVGLNEMDFGQHDQEKIRDMMDDVFWLFPLKLYHDIGGYSEYFWFNSEQADFALRAKKQGYSLVYTPEAKIWHKGSVSLGGRDYNPALAYWTVQSTLLLKFLNLPFYNFMVCYFSNLKSVISTYIKTIFFYIFKGTNRLDYAAAKFRGFMYFNSWLITRKKNDGKNPFLNKI